MTIYDKLLAASDEGTTVNVVTLVQAPSEMAQFIGQTILVYPGGHVEGSIISGSFTELIATHVKDAAWTEPHLFPLGHDGEHQLFWDKTVPDWKAVVFGGGHISQPLVAILSLLGFAVTVIDDRPDYANRSRFPQAKEVICAKFAEVFRGERLQINERTALIIVTRGHQHDLECLQACLPLAAGYMGMIGSRRRVAGIVAMLKEQGVPVSRLLQLRAPIGLDIGAKTPAEIAVSIAAEIVAVVRAGSLRQPRIVSSGVANNG